jgi:hypothetical protein
LQIDEEGFHTKGKSTVKIDTHNTCGTWTKKYDDAYDKWIRLPEGAYKNDWERKILN